MGGKIHETIRYTTDELKILDGRYAAAAKDTGQAKEQERLL